MSVVNIVHIESIVTSMYEQLRHHPILDWNRTPDNALHVVFDTRAEDFGYEADGNTHHPEWAGRATAYLHVMVTARHRVYVAESQEHDPEQVDPLLWKNSSNHDSCWRSDGLDFFTKWYFWAAEFVQKGRPEELRVPPAHTNISARLGGFLGSRALNFVKVTRGPRVSRDSYFDTVEKVENLKFVLVEGTGPMSLRNDWLESLRKGVELCEKHDHAGDANTLREIVERLGGKL